VRLGKRIFARGDFTVHPAFFTRPKLSYTFRHYDVDVFKNGDLDFDVRYNQSQAEFTPFNFDLRNFNVQVGLRWDYVHYLDKLGSDHAVRLTLPNQHFVSYRTRVNYNSEDHWYFPTQGARFKAEYAYVTNDFTQLDVLDDFGNKVGKTSGMHEVSADWRMSFTIGKRFTLQPMFYGRLLFGDEVPTIFGNTVGGSWFGHYIEQQMPFAGIGNMEFVKQHFVAAQLQAQERIGKNHYIIVRAAVGAHSGKLGQIFDNRALIGGQIAYYYNTMFGPLGAAFGYSNHTKKLDFFLNLGHEF
jgi:NTE family protein